MDFTQKHIKNKTSSFNVDSLSEHIFWDVDTNSLDINKNFGFILQRILKYGVLSDWMLLYKTFGMARIANEAKLLRDLENKSLLFIATLSNSNLSEFRCYTTKQSIPQHWNF